MSAVDQDTREALGDIKGAINRGFEDVNKRIDKLVTQGEFNATVQRIDAQHETLRRDFDGHEKRTNVIISDNRAADAAVLEKAEGAVQKVRQEIHKDLDGFRSTTKWAVGIAVTLAGLAFGVASWLLSL
ncbi:hypothetical protein [Microbacterium sp. No. 7]|uniref:hypothetical protein n=1 Tax=Microbacterium sp. No. 7 TaxID=1714373 RepID=UPI0006D1D2C1|nr:hypothetical protein [Microbacterium sp. No. 7]ALJ19571.1 hypothetical protein AOA12_06470 [Microbacterium sp. No. 7]